MFTKIQIVVGDAVLELAGGQLRTVEFEGRELAQTPVVVFDEQERREVTQTLYETADHRLIVYESSKLTLRPGRERVECHLIEVAEADLKRGGKYASLGALTEFAEFALTLDEALCIEQIQRDRDRRYREDVEWQARVRRMGR